MRTSGVYIQGIGLVAGASRVRPLVEAAHAATSQALMPDAYSPPFMFSDAKIPCFEAFLTASSIEEYGEEMSSDKHDRAGGICLLKL